MKLSHVARHVGDFVMPGHVRVRVRVRVRVKFRATTVARMSTSLL